MFAMILIILASLIIFVPGIYFAFHATLSVLTLYICFIAFPAFLIALVVTGFAYIAAPMIALLILIDLAWRIWKKKP